MLSREKLQEQKEQLFGLYKEFLSHRIHTNGLRVYPHAQLEAFKLDENFMNAIEHVNASDCFKLEQLGAQEQEEFCRVIAYSLPLDIISGHLSFKPFKSPNADLALQVLEYRRTPEQFLLVEGGKALTHVLASDQINAQMPLSKGDMFSLMQELPRKPFVVPFDKSALAQVFDQQRRLFAEREESYTIPLLTIIENQSELSWLFIEVEVNPATHQLAVKVHAPVNYSEKDRVSFVTELNAALQKTEWLELAGLQQEFKAFPDYHQDIEFVVAEGGLAGSPSADFALHSFLNVSAAENIDHLQGISQARTAADLRIATLETMLAKQSKRVPLGFGKTMQELFAQNAPELASTITVDELMQQGEFYRFLGEDRATAYPIVKEDRGSLFENELITDPLQTYSCTLDVSQLFAGCDPESKFRARAQAWVEQLNTKTHGSAIELKISEVDALSEERRAILVEALQQCRSVMLCSVEGDCDESSKNYLHMMAARNVALLSSISKPNLTQDMWSFFFSQWNRDGFGVQATSIQGNSISFLSSFGTYDSMVDKRHTDLQTLFLKFPEIAQKVALPYFANTTDQCSAPTFELFTSVLIEHAPSAVDLESTADFYKSGLKILQFNTRLLQEGRHFFSATTEHQAVLLIPHKELDDAHLNQQWFEELKKYFTTLAQLPEVEKVKLVLRSHGPSVDVHFSEEQIKSLIELLSSAECRFPFALSLEDGHEQKSEFDIYNDAVARQQALSYQPQQKVKRAESDQDYKPELDYYRRAKKTSAAVDVEPGINIDHVGVASDTETDNDTEQEVAQSLIAEPTPLPPYNKAVCSQPCAKQVEVLPELLFSSLQEEANREKYLKMLISFSAKASKFDLGNTHGFFFGIFANAQLDHRLNCKDIVKKIFYPRSGKSFKYSAQGLTAVAYAQLHKDLVYFASGIPESLPPGYQYITTHDEQLGDVVLLDYDQRLLAVHHPMHQGCVNSFFDIESLTNKGSLKQFLPQEQQLQKYFALREVHDEQAQADALRAVDCVKNGTVVQFFDLLEAMDERPGKEIKAKFKKALFLVDVKSFEKGKFHFYDDSDALRALYITLQDKGIAGVQDVLQLLVTLKQADENLFEHFYKNFVGRRGSPPVKQLASEASFAALSTLMSLTEVEKQWWREAVDNHFQVLAANLGDNGKKGYSKTGFYDDFASMFEAFDYFRKFIASSGLSVISTMPFAPTINEAGYVDALGCENFFVAHDRLLTVLSNINPSYVSTQLKNLNGLDWSNQGAVYAAKYLGYQFVHPAMRLSPLTLDGETYEAVSKILELEGREPYAVDLAFLQKICQEALSYGSDEDDVSYFRQYASINFIRYMGVTTDYIDAAHFEQYVDLANQLCGLDVEFNERYPHFIQQKMGLHLLPTVALLVTGHRGASHISAEEIAEFFAQQDLTAAYRVEQLTALTDKLHALVASLPHRPRIDEFAAMLRFCDAVAPQHQEEVLSYLQEHASAELFKALASWNKHPQRVEVARIIDVMFMPADTLSPLLKQPLLAFLLQLKSAQPAEVEFFIAQLPQDSQQACALLNALGSRLAQAKRKVLTLATINDDLFPLRQDNSISIAITKLDQALQSAPIIDATKLPPPAFDIEEKALAYMTAPCYYDGDTEEWKSRLGDFLDDLRGQKLEVNLALAGLTSENIIQEYCGLWNDVCKHSAYKFAISHEKVKALVINQAADFMYIVSRGFVRHIPPKVGDTSLEQAFLNALYEQPFVVDFADPEPNYDPDSGEPRSTIKRLFDGNGFFVKPANLEHIDQTIAQTVDYCYAMTPLVEAIYAIDSPQQRQALLQAIQNSALYRSLLPIMQTDDRQQKTALIKALSAIIMLLRDIKPLERIEYANKIFAITLTARADEAIEQLSTHQENVAKVFEFHGLSHEQKHQIIDIYSQTVEPKLELSQLAELLQTLKCNYSAEQAGLIEKMLPLMLAGSSFTQAKLIALLATVQLQEVVHANVAKWILQAGYNDLSHSLDLLAQHEARKERALNIFAHVDFQHQQQIMVLTDERFDRFAALYEHAPYPPNEIVVSLLNPDLDQFGFTDIVSRYEKDPESKRSTPEAKQAFYAEGLDELSRYIDGFKVGAQNPRSLLLAEKKELLDEVLYVNYLGYELKLEQEGEYADSTCNLSNDALRAAFTQYSEFLRDHNPQDPQFRITQLKVIAIIREMFYRHTQKQEKGTTFHVHPYLVQMIPLISCSRNSSFAQIDTGQGKTFISGMMSALLNAHGKPVDVCSSNKKLAQEGHDENAAFFDSLRIKHTLIESADAPYQADGINYGDISNIALCRLNGEIEGKDLPPAHLIVDEGDYLFDTVSNYRHTQNFSGDSENKDTGLLLAVYRYVSRPEYSTDGKRSIKDLDALVQWVSAQEDIAETIKTRLMGLVNEERAMAYLDMKQGYRPTRGYVGCLLDDAFLARGLLRDYNESYALRGDHFIGEETAAVAVKEKGNKRKAPDSAKFSGYVHTLMHAVLDYYRQHPEEFNTEFNIPATGDKHIPLKDDLVVFAEQRFVVPPARPPLLQMNGLAMMKRALRKDGARLFSLSGTMQSPWVEELAEELHADVDRIEPRKKSKMIVHEPIIVAEKEVKSKVRGRTIKTYDYEKTWRESYFTEILARVREGIKKGQEIILFADEVKDVERLYRELEKALGRVKGKYKGIQQYAEEHAVESERIKEENEVKRKAGQAGFVTVTTSLLARGTDIEQEYGRVIDGSLHREPDGRGARQRGGRIARNGKPGEWFTVVHPQEFKQAKDIMVDGLQATIDEPLVEVNPKGEKGETARRSIAKLRDLKRQELESKAKIQHRFSELRTKIEDSYLAAMKAIRDDLKVEFEGAGVADPSAFIAKFKGAANKKWKVFYEKINEYWNIIESDLLSKRIRTLDEALKTFKAYVNEYWQDFTAEIAALAIEKVINDQRVQFTDVEKKRAQYANADIDYDKAITKVSQRLDERMHDDLVEGSIKHADLAVEGRQPSASEIAVAVGADQSVITKGQALNHFLQRHELRLKQLGILLAKTDDIDRVEVRNRAMLRRQIHGLLNKAITSANGFVYKNRYWELINKVEKFGDANIKAVLFNAHVDYIKYLFTREIANQADPQIAQSYQNWRLLLQARMFDFDKRGLLPANTTLDADRFLVFQQRPLMRSNKGRLLKGDDGKFFRAKEDKVADTDFNWQQLYSYAKLQLKGYLGNAWFKASDRKVLAKQLLARLGEINSSDVDAGQKIKDTLTALNGFNAQLMRDDKATFEKRWFNLRNHQGSRLETIMRNVRSRAHSVMSLGEDVLTSELGALAAMIDDLKGYQDEFMQRASKQNHHLIERCFAVIDAYQQKENASLENLQALREVKNTLLRLLPQDKSVLARKSEQTFCHMFAAVIDRVQRLDAATQASPALREVLNPQLVEHKAKLVKVASAKASQLNRGEALAPYVAKHFSSVKLPASLGADDRYRCQLMMHEIEQYLKKTNRIADAADVKFTVSKIYDGIVIKCQHQDVNEYKFGSFASASANLKISTHTVAVEEKIQANTASLDELKHQQVVEGPFPSSELHGRAMQAGFFGKSHDDLFAQRASTERQRPRSSSVSCQPKNHPKGSG